MLQLQLVSLGRFPIRSAGRRRLRQGLDVLVHHRRSRIRLTCSLMIPPLPLTYASAASLTWRPSPRPINWRTPSTTWLMPPPSPGWPNESCPPWVLHGKSPAYERSCSVANGPLWPFLQKPASSSVTSTVIV